jgi:hypothetical protein
MCCRGWFSGSAYEHTFHAGKPLDGGWNCVGQHEFLEYMGVK